MGATDVATSLFDRQRRRSIAVGLLLLPLAAFFAVLWFVPIAYTVFSSFFENPIGESLFVGLGNYAAILAGETFWGVLWNSVVFAVSTTALSVVVGLAFALAVDRALFGGGSLRTMMVFPYLLPTVVVV
ncbi:MAG: hypothetical protein V5A23_04535, partial [Halobacteriales archaeon]